MARVGEALRSAELGVRVRRGPDWRWADQDGGGLGSDTRGWVRVLWDAGRDNSYRVGADGMYDLVMAEASLTVAQFGVRVVRGPDWKWGNQDGGGAGTTIPGAVDEGWICVQWDCDSESVYQYRIGAQWCYDLFIGSSSLSTAASQILTIATAGVRVRRGQDWKWGNQDGTGPGTTIESAENAGWVRVRWDNTGIEHRYRVGAQGMYDLIYDEDEDAETSETISVCDTQFKLGGRGETCGYDEPWMDPEEAASC